MFSKLVSSAAAAALAAAPIVAQAAPDRVAAPTVSEEGIEGSSWVIPAIVGLGLIIVIWLALDSENDNELPDSP